MIWVGVMLVRSVNACLVIIANMLLNRMYQGYLQEYQKLVATFWYACTSLECFCYMLVLRVGNIGYNLK